MAWIADESVRMNFIIPMRSNRIRPYHLFNLRARRMIIYFNTELIRTAIEAVRTVVVYHIQPSRNCRPMNWLPDYEWCHSRGSRSNLHGAILFYPRIQGPACVSSCARARISICGMKLQSPLLSCKRKFKPFEASSRY